MQTIPNRKRNIQISVRFTEEEKELVYLKMQQYKTDNLSAYIRKMAIDGYIIVLDLSEMKEHTSELHTISRSIYQIAKQLKISGNLYPEDMAEIQKSLKEIWKEERKIYFSLRKRT